MSLYVDPRARPAVAAIYSRSSALVERLLPLGPTPHGFYDPDRFLESCQRGSARAEAYRDFGMRIIHKEVARGHLTIVDGCIFQAGGAS